MIEMDHLLGVAGHAATVVGPENTAVTVGSGTLPVFSTPSMAALMEQAAVQALQNFLPLGCTTVGMGISVKHLAATPVGHNVHAEAVVTAVEGRRIGEGTHERFMIDAESFMGKLVLKKPKS
ncbi:MAG: thioesterase family protein [Candidatus Sericytochromatia bacterium]